MRIFAVISAAALAAGLAGPALAQTSPSTSAIIQGLTPKNLTNTSRGIRPLGPVAPVSPGAAAPATPAPAAPATTTAATTTPAAPAAAAPAVSLTVEFATNSARLTPAARGTLDKLGAALSSAQLAQYRFRIEGHTDTVGSPGYNLALSQRRADAVAAYLEAHFGISASRLVAVGMGEKGLLVPTPPQTPEARNRRVQVVNIGS